MRRNLLLVACLILVFTGCKKTRPEVETSADPAAPRGVAGSEESTASDRQAQGEAVAPLQTRDIGSSSAFDGDVEHPPADAGAVPSLTSLSWTIFPEQLDVMRATEVKLSARWDGAQDGSYECLWDPGDRTGALRGCEITHTYETGLADRKVTLNVMVGGETVFNEARSLPLERLSVKDLPGDAPTRLPPIADGKSVRVLLWAAFSAPDQGDLKAVRKALESSGATHAVLFFNMRVDGAATRGLIDSLQEETGVAFMPVFCGGMAGDGVGWKLPPTFVPHGRANDVPYRHSAIADGIGYVVLDSRETGNDVAQEKWMLERLQEMRVAAHRIVLSCRPMESLTGEAREMTPQFRYYEKLLRGDISALVSSGDPVFYHGGYGDLSAISAGCATGVPGTIAGTETPQEKTIGVLDLQPGKKTAAWSLSATAPDKLIGPDIYPRKVGNYERKL